MMASATLATNATPSQGASSPTLAEQREFYTQLLRLRDVVVAGKHASLRLSAPAIARLKASFDAERRSNGTTDAFAATTNHKELQYTPVTSSLQPSILLASYNGSRPSAAVDSNHPGSASASGLDPIFLEKSDIVIRAEGQLKRQRLERDLQAQVEQRKNAIRDRDSAMEGPSPLDIDLVLSNALARVKHASGLNQRNGSLASSSFDENDYYSSQVQSDWSSETHASRGSDRAAGAFTADYELLHDEPQAVLVPPSIRTSRRITSLTASESTREPATNRGPTFVDGFEDAHAIADEDDDYTPPEAAAFDSFQSDHVDTTADRMLPLDDENSDYEPGEISDSYMPTVQDAMQEDSPHVPVIRNHLTHIAAPQPNRVSPLATAKGPSYELQLVNGRPEMVQKRGQLQQKVPRSRASTTSPPGNGVGNGKKKKNNKKRKREAEALVRIKKRKDRRAASGAHGSTALGGPYIKNEPVSPPPFASLPDVPEYRHMPLEDQPVTVDLSFSGRGSQIQPTWGHIVSGPQYPVAQPESGSFIRLSSPMSQRPVARDQQDLRRVASMHHAERPMSSQRSVYSPVGPYRTVSMPQAEYQDLQQSGYVQRSEAAPTPSRPPEYAQPFAARFQSPATMQPPPVPVQKVVVDQHGNRYYAAGPAPATASKPSAAPAEQSRLHMAYDHGAGQIDFGQITRGQPSHADKSEHRLASIGPPPPETRTAIDFYDPSGSASRQYQMPAPRASQPSLQYTEAPSSPQYQQVPSYGQMAPPQQHAISGRQATTMVQPVPRSYSVLPEASHNPAQAAPAYLRHASVAPVQYARHEQPGPSMRAASVMPSSEHHAAESNNVYRAPAQAGPREISSQPAQGTVFVDQYGNQVFPRHVREVRY